MTPATSSSSYASSLTSVSRVFQCRQVEPARSPDARPAKIANYPFTTLTPTRCRSPRRARLVVADIPGLSKAPAGRGPWREFLRHIERTRLIVHVVDASLPDPLAAIATIDTEIAAYGHALDDCPSSSLSTRSISRRLATPFRHRVGSRGGGARSDRRFRRQRRGRRPFEQAHLRALRRASKVEAAAPAERRIVFAGGAKDVKVAREGEAYRVLATVWKASRGDRLGQPGSVGLLPPPAASVGVRGQAARAGRQRGRHGAPRQLGSSGLTRRSSSRRRRDEEALRARIGVFGGTFDPVHVGHLAIALAAVESVPLDRMLFVPAAFAAEGPRPDRKRHRPRRDARGCHRERASFRAVARRARARRRFIHRRHARSSAQGGRALSHPGGDALADLARWRTPIASASWRRSSSRAGRERPSPTRSMVHVRSTRRGWISARESCAPVPLEVCPALPCS